MKPPRVSYRLARFSDASSVMGLMALPLAKVVQTAKPLTWVKSRRRSVRIRAQLRSPFGVDRGFPLPCLARIVPNHFAMNESLMLGLVGADARATSLGVLDVVGADSPVGLDLVEALEASGHYTLT